DGQTRLRRRHSSACLWTPAASIQAPPAVVRRKRTATCGSRAICLVRRLLAAAPVRVRLVVQLPAAPIGYVRVELRRGEIGVSEHLLDAAEVGAALEQVRGEGVPKQVRMDTFGVEAGFRREPPHDQEGAGPR